MYTSGNMVASVKLATAKKNGCVASYGCSPGNMVASINLATAKKQVARPPMVALLAIWLRPLTWLPQKMVARPPMVALLAIWLRPLTWLPQKKRLHMVALLAIWLRSLTMVASFNLATAKKMVALKTDQIQITRGNQ
jgi:hypothetical protein